jgi:hypothetical protein
MATAILLVYFSAGSRAMRAFGWAYLAGTVLATLAFEHYLIDLVVAVPYALFVIAAAEGRWRDAARKLAVVAGWLVTIRFATPLLVQIPLAVPVMCLATIALALFSRGGASDLAGRSVETAKGSRSPALTESFDRLPAR